VAVELKSYSNVLFISEQIFNYTATVITLNANFIDVHEIWSTETKCCILYSLFYNKEVYNLMMADIEAETCSC
jgi:hypothetical protein